MNHITPRLGAGILTADELVKGRLSIEQGMARLPEAAVCEGSPSAGAPENESPQLAARRSCNPADDSAWAEHQPLHRSDGRIAAVAAAVCGSGRRALPRDGLQRAYSLGATRREAVSAAISRRSSSVSSASRSKKSSSGPGTCGSVSSSYHLTP